MEREALAKLRETNWLGEEPVETRGRQFPRIAALAQGGHQHQARRRDCGVALNRVAKGEDLAVQGPSIQERETKWISLDRRPRQEFESSPRVRGFGEVAAQRLKRLGNRQTGRGCCSTTRTRRPADANSWNLGFRRCRRGLFHTGGEPERGALSGVTFNPDPPSIISASCLEMARPKPVPPKLRVVGPVRLDKGEKRCSTRSGGMPLPVSSTATDDGPPLCLPSQHQPAPGADLPLRVNFTALPSQVQQDLAQTAGVAS